MIRKPSPLRREMRQTALLCSLLVLGGCGSILHNRYINGLTTGDFSSDRISEAELREALIQYASRFEATVIATANTISTGTKDPAVQRRALRWKIELTPVVNEAAFSGTAEAAYVAVLTIATSMNEYVTTGGGAEAFGEQRQLAIDASAELLQAAVAVGDRFLDDKELARVTSEVKTLVREQPIRGEFVAEKIQTLATTSESSPAFGWVTAIPLSPFRALQGVDAGAQGIREFNVTAAEMSRILATMPRLLRWNLELFTLDLTQQGDVASTLASFDALARSAGTLSQSVASLPESLRAVLEEADRTGQGLTPLSQSLERSAAAVAAAGSSWGALITEFDKPPTDPTKPSRPFDIREWEQTAAQIGSAATELRALLTSVGTLAGSETLAGPLADLTARVERVEAGSRALVNLAALRALEVILAFFVLLFVYRRIERRLDRREASQSGHKDAR